MLGVQKETGGEEEEGDDGAGADGGVGDGMGIGMGGGLVEPNIPTGMGQDQIAMGGGYGGYGVQQGYGSAW